MNIVKVLKKQIESGKTIVMPSGDIISEEEIKKTAMKEYLAGVKSGEISTDISFSQYLAETGDSYANVQEVIDFIENPNGEDEEDAAE